MVTVLSWLTIGILYTDFLKKPVVTRKFSVKGVYASGAFARLPDRQQADEYKIKSIDQLVDPKLVDYLMPMVMVRPT